MATVKYRSITPSTPLRPPLAERVITWTIIMLYRWHVNKAHNTLYFVSPNKSTLRQHRLYAFPNWWALTLNTLADLSFFIMQDIKNCE
jgi:hypothetical protein